MPPCPAPGQYFLKSFYFFSNNFYSLYITITVSTSFHPSPTLTNSSPIVPSSSEKKGNTPWTPSYLGHLVPAGLDTSSPTEDQLGSPGRRKGIQWQGTETQTALAANTLHSAPSCSLVGGPASVSHHRPRLVDSIGLLMVSLTLLAFSILSLTLLQDSLSST